MERVRSKPIYALLAGAVLGVVVMPIAFAGAAGNPQATASASVKKQVKKLKQQVNQLRQQVEDVSKQAGAQGPAGTQGPPGPATGPAGGDLAGTYPNPLIGPDAVGTDEIASNAVVAGKIAPGAVTTDGIQDGQVQTPDLGPSSVGSSQLKADSVGSPALNADSVGSSELQRASVGADDLKRVSAVVGSGVTVSAGTPANAEVACPAGDMVIGGGYAWQEDEANSIIASAPSEVNPTRIWIVRGMVDAGSNNLFAWANCLPN